MGANSKATPVYMKSEFWVTLVTAVSGLLMAFGVVTPAQSDTVATVAPQIIGAILTLFSSSKFVATQHAAKVEVFRAMCAMRIGAPKGVSAKSAGVGDDVSSIARMAGL